MAPSTFYPLLQVLAKWMYHNIKVKSNLIEIDYSNHLVKWPTILPCRLSLQNLSKLYIKIIKLRASITMTIKASFWMHGASLFLWQYSWKQARSGREIICNKGSSKTSDDRLAFLHQFLFLCRIARRPDTFQNCVASPVIQSTGRTDFLKSIL